jgi:serine/threonine-protein kinase
MSLRDRSSIPGSSSVPPGTRLNGIYEIDQFIASGGMGEIYAGHSVEIGDKVAIKVVLPEFAADELILKLFRKEAHILHRLNHDAIVRYHMFAVDEQLGRSYLAMEFVDGLSLAERLRSGPLSLEDTIILKNRLSDGLEQAHEAGIVHRDLSPDNVILPDNSVSLAKIIDFGIAKAVTAGAERTLIGSTFAGRQTYASPEQLGMFAPARVTNRSDIYSLGLVLAAALRGEPIDMSGSQVAAIEKRREVPDLSDIPGRMRRLLMAMLQPNPADRLASMAEVRDWEITTPPPLVAPIPLRRAIAEAPAADRQATPRRTPVITRSLSKRPSLPPRPDYRDDFAEPKSRFGLWIGIGTVLTILAGAAGGWFYVQNVAPPPVQISPTVPGAPVTDHKTDMSTGSRGTSGDGTTPDADSTKNDRPPEPAPLKPRTGRPETIIASIGDAANFIREFDGGSCFFMWPVDLGDRVATVEGYGPDIGVFARFQEQFQAAAGYEPDVRARTVSRAQCSVVESLRRISRARGKGINPSLTLQSRQTLAEGEILTGSVLAPPNLKLELLVVDDIGKTHQLTNSLKPDGRFAFSVKTTGVGAAGEAPQLLIVLASPEKLQLVAGLGPDSPVDAATVFPRLAEQSEAGGRITLTVGYFKLAAH